MSITDAVREIIIGNRSIHDCMKMNVINYTALAIKILPSVEQELGYQVNLNTIVVAIKRYADSFKEKEALDESTNFKNVKLILTGSIMDVVLPSKFGDDPGWLKDHFVNSTNFEFFKLDNSFRILIDDVDEIRNFIDTMSNESIYQTGLAKIKIQVPDDENKSAVGSFVIDVIHRSGIELKNVFFNQDGITLVVDELYASKAYEILRTKL